MGDCKLADYAYKYGVKDSSFAGATHQYAIDDSNPFIIRNLKQVYSLRRLRAGL